MVHIFNTFQGTEAGLKAFLQVAEDQELSGSDFVEGFDTETGIFEVDFSAFDFEVTNAEAVIAELTAVKDPDQFGMNIPTGVVPDAVGTYEVMLLEQATRTPR